ncbi:hypothetical protein FNL55_17325 [Tardiphaga sp. vice352]|uniref:hypothetical protein n=1 Tax=unclassified Tardiphaga TaxID=2631404 RepID=UPI00116391AB|nr:MULTISPECIES: hypothetical protein [unclassified Tardiphaga]QDM17513.1 hypothetical protein FNL53_17375 [Tardiphaga sp. vice278]QDM22482.1 hypothetical protein FIU28_15955 [Tardiphaga sp. vice154]QDM27770.1 hypothetical protein FNL56_17790 [Tardiphaga sp. vice304]QDM32922.1 hypothetical protein FNL55_17325 [Tardiphaga sp. vice352]
MDSADYLGVLEGHLGRSSCNDPANCGFFFLISRCRRALRLVLLVAGITLRGARNGGQKVRHILRSRLRNKSLRRLEQIFQAYCSDPASALGEAVSRIVALALASAMRTIPGNSERSSSQLREKT